MRAAPSTVASSTVAAETGVEVESPRSSSAEAPTSAVVATAFPAATEAALKMLKAGGNAVDAAAAAAWALSVCEPSGSGLGGQATMLISFPNGESVVLDGHSHGPAAVSRRTVSRVEQRRGWKATTIPSMPATIGAAVGRYGRMPLSTTLAPAIELAEEGSTVTRLLRRHIQWCREALLSTPATARAFLPEGVPPRKGDRLVQPELGRTLRRLAADGTDDFYRGAIARDIVTEMAEQGGLITERDLRESELPITRQPISISYHGHEVMSVPPPGGGAQLLLGLKLAEALGLRSRAGDEVDWYEMIAILVDSVFRERAQWPVDPKNVPPSLLQWLLSDQRVVEIADDIRAGRNRGALRSPEGPGDTTHLCVADAEGTVVSLTQSVQSLFGSKVASERLGFVYNNYLCTCPRYRHPSQLRADAMPQSNAAPTIVFAGDLGAPRVPILALGSAGSRRITSSILQVITNLLDRRLTLTGALDAPRIHTTLSGRPLLENRIATDALKARLAQRFRAPELKAARSYSMGAVQAIQRRTDGTWIGAADPRREGTARGC